MTAKKSLKDKVKEARAKRMEQIPPSLQVNYQKALKSKAAALKAMCVECCGFERKVIRECTSYACPLWVHRPYQRNESGSDE